MSKNKRSSSIFKRRSLSLFSSFLGDSSDAKPEPIVRSFVAPNFSIKEEPSKPDEKPKEIPAEKPADVFAEKPNSAGSAGSGETPKASVLRVANGSAETVENTQPSGHNHSHGHGQNNGQSNGFDYGFANTEATQGPAEHETAGAGSAHAYKQLMAQSSAAAGNVTTVKHPIQRRRPPPGYMNGHERTRSEIEELQDQVNDLIVSTNGSSAKPFPGKIETNLARQNTSATQPASSVYNSQPHTATTLEPLAPHGLAGYGSDNSNSSSDLDKDLAVSNHLQLVYSHHSYIEEARRSSENLDLMITENHDKLRKEHEVLDQQLLLLSPKNRDSEEHEELKRHSLLFNEEEEQQFQYQYQQQQQQHHHHHHQQEQADVPFLQSSHSSELFHDAKSGLNASQFSFEPQLKVPEPKVDTRSRQTSIGQQSDATYMLRNASTTEMDNQGPIFRLDDEEDDSYSHSYRINSSGSSQVHGVPSFSQFGVPDTSSTSSSSRHPGGSAGSALKIHNPDVESLDNSSIGHNFPPAGAPLSSFATGSSIVGSSVNESVISEMPYPMSQETPQNFSTAPTPEMIPAPTMGVPLPVVNPELKSVPQRMSNPHLPKSVYDARTAAPEVKQLRINSKMASSRNHGEKSSYVESIRQRSMCANVVSTQTRRWPLPMGIRPVDMKQIQRKSASSLLYTKPSAELKHVSLQPRLLRDAEDDEEMVSGDGVFAVPDARMSMDSTGFSSKKQSLRGMDSDDEEDDFFIDFKEEDFQHDDDENDYNGMSKGSDSDNDSDRYSYKSPTSAQFDTGAANTGALHLFVANPDSD